MKVASVRLLGSILSSIRESKKAAIRPESTVPTMM